MRARAGTARRAVLEVRSREVPFILEHGQIVGRLVYEKMLARPDTLYGQGIGSNYQAQGLKLSKHFGCEPAFAAASGRYSNMERRAVRANFVVSAHQAVSLLPR